MKRLLAICTLMAAPVFAEHVVSLPPGGAIFIDGTTIRCTGVMNVDAPKCRVEQFSGTTYSIYVGSNRWGYVDGFDNAVKTVKTLKETGLCN